jgi:hypothetical protein
MLWNWGRADPAEPLLARIMQGLTCSPRFCCILVMISILILTGCYYDDMLDDMLISRIIRHRICRKARLYHTIGYMVSPKLRALCYSKEFS